MDEINITDRRSILELKSVIEFCNKMVIKDADKAASLETTKSMQNSYHFINAVLRADSLDEYTITPAMLKDLELEGINNFKYGDLSPNKIPDEHKDIILEYCRYIEYKSFMVRQGNLGEINQYYVDLYNTYFKNTETIYSNFKDFMDMTQLPAYASMRLANDFDLIWCPQTVLTAHETVKFKSCYNRAKTYFMKVCYNEAYEVTNGNYKKLCKLFIVFLAIKQYINSRLENIDDIDLFDEYSIRNMFLSYGLDYFFDMPLKYQRRILKNINYLIKNKGTDKGIVNVLQIFGFDNIKIMRYILAKEYPRDPNTGKLLLNAPELKFYELSSDDEKIEDAIKNAGELPYDEFVREDKYWQLSDSERKLLYQENFNYVYTKYISIASQMDMVKYGFEFSYFINFIYRVQSVFHPNAIGGDKELANRDKLYFYDFNISEEKLYLFDAILCLFSLVMKKYGYSDNIIKNASSINKVYDFNLDEMARDVTFWNKKKLFASTINGYKNNHLSYIDPNKDLNVTDLCTLFMNNMDFKKELESIIMKQKSRRKFGLYNSLYKCCFLSEYRYSVFREFETFKDYLKVNSEPLYKYIDNCENRAKLPNTDNDAIYDQYILELCNDIDTFLDKDDINFFIQGNNFMNDYIRTFIYQLIDFIKSYTIHVRNMDTIYIFDDRFSNTIFFFDETDIDDEQTFADLKNFDEELSMNNKFSLEPEEVMHEVEELIMFRHTIRIHETELKDIKDDIEFMNNISISDLVTLHGYGIFEDYIKEIEAINLMEEYEWNNNLSYIENTILKMDKLINEFIISLSSLYNLSEKVINETYFTADCDKISTSSNYDMIIKILLKDKSLKIKDNKFIFGQHIFRFAELTKISDKISIFQSSFMQTEQVNIKDRIQIHSTAYDNVFGFKELMDECMIYEDINTMHFDLNRLINKVGRAMNDPMSYFKIELFGEPVYYRCKNTNYYDFTYQDGILIISKAHGNFDYVMLTNAKIQFLDRTYED